ncbi:MAG: phage head closure protein, partial [Clostridia bacterium]
VKEYAVWASVAPTTGREYEEAQKLRGETTYKLITRYFPNITSDMKIMFGLQVLDIISVLNINERNTELQIIAKEKDCNGKEY